MPYLDEQHVIIKDSETVIDKEELLELQADSQMLASLTAHGVDNWEGYEDAFEEASTTN